MSQRDTPIILKNDDKISIIMQEESFTYQQMENLKNQEMAWLRNFMLFYSALIAWGASRWLSSKGTNICTHGENFSQCQVNEWTIIYTILGLSCFATILFSYMFLRTRWSFYSLMERLAVLQNMLHFEDTKVWSFSMMSKSKYIFEDIDDRATWEKVTKPTHSFLTRLIFIMGANLSVAFIGTRGLYNLDNSSTMPSFLICCVGTCLLFVMIFRVDYIHFTRKSISSKTMKTKIVGEQSDEVAGAKR